MVRCIVLPVFQLEFSRKLQTVRVPSFVPQTAQKDGVR